MTKTIARKSLLRLSRLVGCIPAVVLLAGCGQETPAPPPESDRSAAAAPVQSPAELDANLVRQVRADLADVFATGDDFTIVSAVREWAYARVDRAGNASVTLDKDPAFWRTESIGKVFERLEKNEGGFFCSGTATFLVGLYRALGYWAITYNVGFPGTLVTHELTLVEIPHEGKRVLNVQDAYFGYTIVQGGGPADVFDLIAALGHRDISGFEIRSARDGCKPYVTDSAGERAYLAQYYDVSDVSSSSALHSYCHTFRLERFLATEGKPYLEAVAREGWPRDFLYLLLYPIGSSGGPEMAQAVAAARRG